MRASTAACYRSRVQQPWDPARFRDLLDQVIERTGLTQRAIGERGGFDASRISRWRSGQNRPDYDSIVQLVTGLIRDYPEVADSASGLFEAAGYGPGVAITDPRPDVVRANWADQNVRTMWGLSVTEDQRLSLIEAYLAGRNSASGSAAGCG